MPSLSVAFAKYAKALSASWRFRHAPENLHSIHEQSILCGFPKEKVMNVWNHMMSSHLQEFPRAYALSAKQKRQYRQHQRRYWAILRAWL